MSVGSDSIACLFDLRSRKCIEKLTFADKECTDARGNPDKTNFMMRGCAFSADGRNIYILASKTRYKSFIIKYSVDMVSDSFVVSPVMTAEVYGNTTTGMRMSRNGELILLGCSDGTSKLVEVDTWRTLFSEKRNNLPVTAMAFVSMQDMGLRETEQSADFAITGSADLKYNIIAIDRANGIMDMLWWLISSIVSLSWQVLLTYVVILYSMDYIDYKSLLQ